MLLRVYTFSKCVKSIHEKKCWCTLLSLFEKKTFKVRYFVPNLTHFENSFHSALQHLFENNVITTDMKSSGIHLLNYQSFRHFKPFSFLDKSTGPILPLVVQALNISIILFIIHFFFDFQCKNVNINITSNGKTFFFFCNIISNCVLFKNLKH